MEVLALTGKPIKATGGTTRWKFIQNSLENKIANQQEAQITKSKLSSLEGLDESTKIKHNLQLQKVWRQRNFSNWGDHVQF